MAIRFSLIIIIIIIMMMFHIPQQLSYFAMLVKRDR
jgi:hypothetical protein